MTTVRCDMDRNCTNPVSFLGSKGYAYCAECRRDRFGVESTRPLRKWEIARMEEGKQLRWNWTRADALAMDRVS